MRRCHKCEALNCPQEEYPARLLPTPPPCYIDNLQRRLIKVRKGIFPASLKMILKTKYPLAERRPAPETSVQPDDVIGEDRARENSPSSQCNPPPRRAAVDTVSEEPETPQRSPAIDTESGPGVSRAETQIEGEEIFPLETSMNDFLHLNCTSTEQVWILMRSDNQVQPEVGMDDSNDATTQQAAAREEFAKLTKMRQRQGTTAWAAEQNKHFDRGRSLCYHYFCEREIFACVLSCLFFPCVFVCYLLRIFPVLSTNCRSRDENRYELFGCTGCVNCCTKRGAFTISIFRR